MDTKFIRPVMMHINNIHMKCTFISDTKYISAETIRNITRKLTDLMNEKYEHRIDPTEKDLAHDIADIARQCLLDIMIETIATDQTITWNVHEQKYQYKDPKPDEKESCERTETDFIKTFITENEGYFDNPVNRKLLRSLWESYCLHNHMNTSSPDYESIITGLWKMMPNEDRTQWTRKEHGYDTTNFTAFTAYMGEQLT